jgi:hypothetical protein
MSNTVTTFCSAPFHEDLTMEAACRNAKSQSAMGTTVWVYRFGQACVGFCFKPLSERAIQDDNAILIAIYKDGERQTKP